MTEKYYVVVGCIASGKTRFLNLLKKHGAVDTNRIKEWSGVDSQIKGIRSLFNDYDVHFIYIRSPHDMCMQRFKQSRKTITFQDMRQSATLESNDENISYYMKQLNALYDKQYYLNNGMLPRETQELYAKQGYTNLIDDYICRVIVIDNSVNGDDHLIARIHEIFGMKT